MYDVFCNVITVAVKLHVITSNVHILIFWSNGNVIQSTILSNADKARILQVTNTNGLHKIEERLAANILQRKQLEQQLANYKPAYPTTETVEKVRYVNVKYCLHIYTFCLINHCFLVLVSGYLYGVLFLLNVWRNAPILFGYDKYPNIIAY